MTESEKITPLLIFSHIPKTGGTSLLHLIWANYARHDVFWKGINCPPNKQPDLETVSQCLVVGGHFDLPLFDGHFAHALRSSVIRNPIDRAISFFSHNTISSTQKDRHLWLQAGIDPSSMLKSLKHCKKFRNAVSDAQCRTISGQKQMRAVLDRILTGNYVLGVQEFLEDFVVQLGELLKWEHVETAIHNPGKPGYKERVLREDGLVEVLEELNKEDLALYDWLLKQKYVVHLASPDKIQAGVKLTIESERRYFVPEELRKIQIRAPSLSSISMKRGKSMPLNLKLANNSRYVLSSVGSFPVQIGAHWYDRQGQKIIHEGGRCGIPRPVKKGEAIDLSFKCAVPESLPEGSYLLMFTLIHKGVRWLDTVDQSHTVKLAVTVQ